MGAEDERFRDPGRQRLDPGGVPQTNMPLGADLFQEVELVLTRRRVTEEDLVPVGQAERQAGEPFDMVRRQLRIGVGIRGAHRRGRHLDQVPVVIAAHRRKVERHQPVGRSRGLERPAQAVPEIDDIRDAEPSDIGKHRIERRGIPVDIRDGGKDHQLPR